MNKVRLYKDDVMVVDAIIPQVRAVVASKPWVLEWFNKTIHSWNSFHKRVELRDSSGTLWGLEI